MRYKYNGDSYSLEFHDIYMNDEDACFEDCARGGSLAVLVVRVGMLGLVVLRVVVVTVVVVLGNGRSIMSGRSNMMGGVLGHHGHGVRVVGYGSWSVVRHGSWCVVMGLMHCGIVIWHILTFCI